MTPEMRRLLWAALDKDSGDGLLIGAVAKEIGEPVALTIRLLDVLENEGDVIIHPIGFDRFRWRVTNIRPKASDMIKVLTPQCPLCAKPSTMKVEARAYANWRNGMLIQDAFPAMSKDDRELLTSGTHKECWKELFPEGDE